MAVLSAVTVDLVNQSCIRRRYLSWSCWRRSFRACGHSVNDVKAVFMRKYFAPVEIAPYSTCGRKCRRTSVIRRRWWCGLDHQPGEVRSGAGRCHQDEENRAALFKPQSMETVCVKYLEPAVFLHWLPFGERFSRYRFALCSDGKYLPNNLLKLSVSDVAQASLSG